MPTYSYACTECGNHFDVVQAFTDDALTTCDRCSGRLRKVFGSVGVVFKGSGFYRTDSRDAAKALTNGSNGSNGHSKPDTSTDSGSASGDKSGAGEKTTSGDSPKTSSNGESAASSKTTAAATTPS